MSPTASSNNDTGTSAPTAQRGQPARRPLTGRAFNVNYSSNALVTDLPLNESGQPYQHCNIAVDRGCRLFPLTDDGKPGGKGVAFAYVFRQIYPVNLCPART